MSTYRPGSQTPRSGLFHVHFAASNQTRHSSRRESSYFSGGGRGRPLELFRAQSAWLHFLFSGHLETGPPSVPTLRGHSTRGVSLSEFIYPGSTATGEASPHQPVQSRLLLTTYLFLLRQRRLPVSSRQGRAASANTSIPGRVLSRPLLRVFLDLDARCNCSPPSSVPKAQRGQCPAHSHTAR